MVPEGEVDDTLCIGGLAFARLDAAQVVDRVFTNLGAGRGGWLVTANIDFLQRAIRDPAIGALYRKADLVVADGLPLLWAARAMGRPLPERVAGSDLVWLLAERAAPEGRSLYLLGGDGDAAEKAAAELCARWPELRIAGCSSPRISSPITPGELAPIREELTKVGPDLVYVAFGSPKQEYLIDLLRSDLPASWMMGCGISLSFIAGEIARAPLWMQRAGVEWVHRLSQEPRRLGRRYLLHNLPFTLRLLWRARRARSRETL
jgi:N-acetylglucosaminyldiphosphoundecaprenol N-acetyl-beta-D-mannosaminyltransferase